MATRIAREEKTIIVMIGMFCRDNHGSKILCEDCVGVQDYAIKRLEYCPFQDGKTTCVQCPIHCYKPDMREKIRVIMRYSGPRMVVRHPILAIMHLWDGFRKKPVTRKMG